MVIWLIVIGVVLAALAALFLWSWRGDRRGAAVMRAISTTPAADVAKLPAGTQVEVMGTLRCASPVTGEFSKTPCAHYAATLERHYVTYEYSSVSRRASKRVQRSETLQTMSLSAPFVVEDESGSVSVLPDKATIDGIVAVNRLEPHVENREGEGLAQTAVRFLTTNEETLGHRYKEVHLPLDAPVYVLGVSTAKGAIAAPQGGAKGQSFVISAKSKEAYVADLEETALWTLVLGIASVVVAIALFAGAYYVS